MNIDDIVKDGFILHEDDGRVKGLSILSLRIALRSFFSTYSCMKDNFNIRKSRKDRDYIYSDSYYEACSETIIHFHHFFELVLKDFLRQDSELIVLDGLDDPIILHKLIKKEPIESELSDSLNTIEFGRTLTYICNLVQEKRIFTDGRLDFLLQSKDALKKLNKLRNRLMHRGSFILRYEALDEFIGTYILPIIIEITNLSEFKSLERYWRYTALKCNIDPLIEIMNEFKQKNFDFGKIAYLKELGRAAYNNPLENKGFGINYFERGNKKLLRRLEKIRELEQKNENVSEIKTCPMCGESTLIIYEDIESEYDVVDGEQVCTDAWKYTYEAKCICCTFEINKNYVKKRK
ncbi:hypothetical protein [Pseudobacteroides cellulosolvens]|uniref:Uncharacterized protein n=1 Tax=Pseudobacteroides cellulosolvens ATCC 35603 = DSM 2933 TaxID=398512 RepID=A0A0L6JPH6_9FIRM|nr:hypothetical protein [Pseudobacteroides cellulosolvens]KNY27688.1 hypothetical protein Bccel_2959 [Pseudobacteroides cellulosolvens ATCC 35603 = DSM 2933]